MPCSHLIQTLMLSENVPRRLREGWVLCLVHTWYKHWRSVRTYLDVCVCVRDGCYALFTLDANINTQWERTSTFAWGLGVMPCSHLIQTLMLSENAPRHLCEGWVWCLVHTWYKHWHSVRTYLDVCVRVGCYALFTLDTNIDAQWERTSTFVWGLGVMPCSHLMQTLTLSENVPRRLREGWVLCLVHTWYKHWCSVRTYLDVCVRVGCYALFTLDTNIDAQWERTSTFVWGLGVMPCSHLIQTLMLSENVPRRLCEGWVLCLVHTWYKHWCSERTYLDVCVRVGCYALFTLDTNIDAQWERTSTFVWGLGVMPCSHLIQTLTLSENVPWRLCEGWVLCLVHTWYKHWCSVRTYLDVCVRVGCYALFTLDTNIDAQWERTSTFVWGLGVMPCSHLIQTLMLSENVPRRLCEGWVLCLVHTWYKHWRSVRTYLDVCVRVGCYALFTLDTNIDAQWERTSTFAWGLGVMPCSHLMQTLTLSENVPRRLREGWVLCLVHTWYKHWCSVRTYLDVCVRVGCYALFTLDANIDAQWERTSTFVWGLGVMPCSHLIQTLTLSENAPRHLCLCEGWLLCLVHTWYKRWRSVRTHLDVCVCVRVGCYALFTLDTNTDAQWERTSTFVWGLGFMPCSHLTQTLTLSENVPRCLCEGWVLCLPHTWHKH